MSGTRPIPISSGGRGRASPPTSSGGGSPSALDLGISHSCPVHAPHHNGGTANTGSALSGSGSSSGRFQPPRAPFFGSLPEPSFMHVDAANPMPALLLPPPAHHRDSSSAPPSVVQVRCMYLRTCKVCICGCVCADWLVLWCSSAPVCELVSSRHWLPPAKQLCAALVVRLVCVVVLV